MAQLAIKGHPTRGKEVIEILKMLGGKVYIEEIYKGEYPDRYYFINKNDGFIHTYFSETVDILNAFQTFTLEEFLEKFSYKVGDKAFAFGNKCTIIDAVWDGGIDEVVYTIKLDTSKYTTTKLSNQLQPYKEETMEGQIVTEDITLDKAVMCTFLEIVEGKQRLRIAMNEGFELKEENGNFFVYKKNGEYPKTYEECCKVLGCKADDFFTEFGYNGCDVEISYYEDKIDDLLQNFRKLRYCRDSYWKIAGEQMGLGKPWEPDWRNSDEDKYCIEYSYGRINSVTTNIYNYILAFPTAEMRDAFYENFKDLIEKCKELL